MINTEVISKDKAIITTIKDRLTTASMIDMRSIQAKRGRSQRGNPITLTMKTNQKSQTKKNYQKNNSDSFSKSSTTPSRTFLSSR
jgi:hypothetical protein